MAAAVSPANGPDMSASVRIGTNLVALVASRFASLALALVQTGMIMRALNVAGRGQFGFAQVFAGFFTVVATLGIQRLLVRDISRDPSTAWTCVWTAEAVVAVLSCASLIVMTTIIFFADDNPQARSAVIFAGLWVVALWALQRPFEALMIAKERMARVAVVNITASVLRLLSVYFVLRFRATSGAAHAAIALGNAGSFVLCMALAISVTGWERPRVRLSLAVAQVRECLPFVCAMVFSLIYFKSDMALLKFISGDVAAGIFTPVRQLMEPLLMVAALSGTAVFPALCRFSVDSEENYTKLKRTSARLALIAAFPMAFGLAFLARPVIVLLVSGDAEGIPESTQALRVMCGVIPFFYLNSLGQEYLYAAHKNWHVVRAYGLAALVSVIANALVIWRYGEAGVAGVAGVAVAVNLLISVLFIWEMREEYGAMALGSLLVKTMAACVVMGLAAYWMVAYNLAGAVLVGVLVYVAATWAFGTLTRAERAILARMLKAIAPFSGR